VTLQQLRYFCEVARRNLNISQAAAALHITQPGLSRQLRLLEDELGIELFVRNRTRLVRLSDAGAQLVTMAEHALQSAQNIKVAAREYSATQRGNADYSHHPHSKTLQAFEAKGIQPHIALNAIDADVIKTYAEFGLGIAIVADIAYDRARDKNLRAIDASHLFEPNTIQIGIRRNHYLRGYMFAFIEMFAPHLKRSVVEAAITKMATRKSKAEDMVTSYASTEFRK